jgi:hypothetical protein
MFGLAIAVHEVRQLDLVPHLQRLQLWLRQNDVGFTMLIVPLRRFGGLAAIPPMLEGDPRTVLYCGPPCRPGCRLPTSAPLWPGCTFGTTWSMRPGA